MGLYAHIHHESLTMYRHCIATKYRAKYRKPTQEPNLGGLSTIDIWEFFGCGGRI